jgi:putative oxidoreductase
LFYKLTFLGFPFAGLQAYVAASAECFGGFCLLVGFSSRLMAIPVMITMATAYATAHGEAVLSLFSKPEHFIEQGLFLFLLTAILVFAFGPGMFSIDYLIQRFIFKKK